MLLGLIFIGYLSSQFNVLERLVIGPTQALTLRIDRGVGIALSTFSRGIRARSPASLPTVWQRIRYRVQQFGASLWPRVAPQEIDQAALWLPPEGVALFLRMIKRDQRHSLDVQQSLLTAGHDQPDLLAAALLHDAAKTAQPGHRLKLSHRVAVVLDAGYQARLGRAGGSIRS